MIKSNLIRSFAFLLVFAAVSLYAGGALAQTQEGTVNTANNTGLSATLQACGADVGMFSDLIKKGTEIFEGLREIIYVVAGFGILAVAVGGFFGNLNWKWLGAIVIGLMVIASTGEILVMITGCEDLNLVSDTLK